MKWHKSLHKNKQFAVHPPPYPRRFTGAKESAGLLALDHRLLLLPVQNVQWTLAARSQLQWRDRVGF